jgi:hypothetical protein
MLSISPTSEAFNTTQRRLFKIELWDTPFTALTSGASPNDLASRGVPMDLREPIKDVDNTFTVASQLAVASAANVRTVFANDAYSAAVATDVGRRATTEQR